MRARVIRSYIDKYSMEDIDKGAEIEVTEERFSELTTGPRGIFVEEIKEEPTADPPQNIEPLEDDKQNEDNKNGEPAPEEEKGKTKKKASEK